ncbi:nonsense-mediated mRNA decay factor [Eremomyces bilateralis CBS 781.70]|uniref:Nonsense-mediated mRNA decay factor n=1 Tax=Eremomyces bilateralis CBS 781.70 TaxID=1392243 RepID=A0A6G1G0Z9_9PEZI|nr:nonsense-mediated mRNA decay factor [Eremomyces bilateralis CBS 781.70]KAF1811787.1 nonsense-mediated mRNA decay factor [Eremomyces bilateralis CBS 781.70]
MEKPRKRELRDLNAGAWTGEKDLYPVHATLDSSMKKNTTFIKRLRTSITASTQSTFLSEVSSLSLTKYLSEILSACYEGLCKLKNPADIAAAVEIVSALHQRFGPDDFTKYLGWFLGRGLATPERTVLKALAPDVREKEEKERLARQRVLLRVVTELWLVGVLRSLEDVARPEEAAAASAGKGKDGPLPGESLGGKKSIPNGAKAHGQLDAEPFPLEVLKDMLGHDRDHVNLPLVVLFVKSFSWDILGAKISSADGRKTVNEDGVIVAGTTAKGEDSASSGEDDITSQDPPMTSPELRERFCNILNRYFEDVKSHIVRDQRHLNQQSRRNAEAYVKSGEVFEDRQANYEKMVKAQEKLISNAQILAEAVGGEIPDLKERDASQQLGDGSIGLVKAGDYLRGQGDGAGIWEDEEERRFYENLIDLKDRVPAILLETKKKKTDVDEPVGKKAEGKDSEDADQKPTGESEDAKSAADTEDQSTAIANKSVGAQVDILLAQLPEMTNKDMVDEIAIQFCFLNSKASRNRMIKAVQDIPKGRTDLLPLYSRLVATLAKYMPDISQGIVSHLDEEFKSLQRRKQKEFLGQVRMMNVRYLAELTKFGVVPEHIIFHCLRVCLDDFSRMNIEIMSTLMENCGRYLIRNPDTSVRMSSFLETVQRKKSAQHLGQQERMLIENACYYVNPPERAAIEQKERTPIELFLRKLIYLELKRGTLDKVGKQIRKMHWEEPEVVAVLRKIFSRPGKLKYSNIHLLAVMLGMLNRYHQDFAISVVDDLLESIIFGLELNDFKFNQRRIAEVKYLGELYIYRMVDSPVIFDTLYKIVTYGHEDGIPNPGKYSPLDQQDDFFRIRLVCNVLETCGVYYSKGAAKKKLDFFLTFFQYYIHTKAPMPMDIEFVVQDGYAATRPQWKLATSIEQASKEFADAVKQNYQSTGPEKPTEADEAEDSSASEDGVDDDRLDVEDIDDDNSSEGEDGNEVEEEVREEHDESEDEDDEDEEENIVVTRPEDERDPELEADFDRELAKMMAESLDSRKADRKPVFDVPLPIRRSQQRDPSTALDEGASEKPEVHVEQSTMVKFSLLSKRGNKQQTKAIDLPSDSSFAVAMRTQQQAEREEQQRIKNLVLNYDLRNDDTDGEDALSIPHLPPNLNRKRSRPEPAQWRSSARGVKRVGAGRGGVPSAGDENRTPRSRTSS